MFTFVVGLLAFHEINNNKICKLSKKSGLFRTRFSCNPYEHKPINIPESIDWRDYNIVTPVKNQGHCGSCWTFSATGAMEGAWAKNTSTLISISEQQLVDCVKKDNGCNGGMMNDAFEYGIENPLCTESQDPYEAIDDKCIKCDSYIQFSSCKDIPENNQLLLKEAVGIYGPISVAIQADQEVFRDYVNGIISDKECGNNLDHGVLIVGYGTENDTKYWIVKNSWGEDWGENGYVRILRSDSNNDPGICGIAMQASFPIV